MSNKYHITKTQLEALLDQEILPEEDAIMTSHIAGCRECASTYRKTEEDALQIQHALVQSIQQATQQIDWNAFALRVSTQLERQPQFALQSMCAETSAPAEITPPATPMQIASEIASWPTRIVQWMRSHPALMLASVATVGIFLLFALPLLDPGPSEKDVIVDRVVKSKTAKVSVLHSKNTMTGQSMTVIVVKEPPSEGLNGTDLQQTKSPSPRQFPMPAPSAKRLQ